MAKVYLSLGSNMGDRTLYLQEAKTLLNAHSQVTLVQCSSLYETKPVGYLDQDLFMNIALEVETSLDPLALLDLCQSVEVKLHRERIIRWGPRTVDVDIIFYDDLDMVTERLELPHPRALERAFVMWPIYELAEDLIVQGRPIKDIIKSLPEDGIRKI